MLSNPEFASWLVRQLETRAPAAVVRFGDGEARLLAPDLEDVDAMEAATGKLRKETGLSFAPEAVLQIRACLAVAFDEADVIGLRRSGRASEEGRMWTARLTELYAERGRAGRPPAAIASCMLHHQVLPMLPGLLAGRRVSVISCRDVKPVLESEWGAHDVAVYQVPSQHLVRDVDGAYEAALHDVPIWPDVHSRLHAELTVREPGEIFLVGAGLFGKDLCIRIRDQGGIALDLGSALDNIAGKITRGPKRRVLDLHARGLSVDDIASEFQRHYGPQVDRDRVARLAESLLVRRNRPSPDPQDD